MPEAGEAVTEIGTPESRILELFDGCIRSSIPVVGEFILPKHLKDMGKSPETFTLDDVDPLMERVLHAVEFCAGTDKSKELKTEFQKIVRNNTREL